MTSQAARRIIAKQQLLDARLELHKDAGLLDLLQTRLGQYLPGDVASLGRLVEVFAAHSLYAERWRELGRVGGALLERDVRGEARADEVDAYLAGCADLLVPVDPKDVPAYRDATPVPVPARKVDAWLYRSAQPRENDLAEVLSMGVKLVVNLREETPQGVDSPESQMCVKLGLDYHRIPVTDQQTPAFEQVLEFIEVVEARGPALVHCWAGRGRTGLFVACYRLWRGVDLEEAIRISDGEAVSRGMRDTQRDWVRANAHRVPRGPAPPAE